MVDPVTLWPVRSVTKSVGEPAARSRAGTAAAAQPAGASASLPKLVGLAADLAKQGLPLDHAKIARIRESMAQGKYSVDVEAIANAMVGFFRTGE